jgi:hypothetical protein
MGRKKIDEADLKKLWGRETKGSDPSEYVLLYMLERLRRLKG